MQYLKRYPEGAATSEYDVIVIGGGIYGITLAIEASRRGQKCLLLEQGDFGEHTSYNSLKIIHGGLRYLQSLDIHRFRESVSERAWFLKHFPSQTKPMPCLMPLYGKGMKRPSIFRIALILNHLLSLDRNKGVDQSHILPVGGILSKQESKEIFPMIDLDGLQGSALWYDGQMEDSQLLVMDILHMAAEMGTTALNYCKVEKINTANGKVTGVTALDRESGKQIEFRADTVINGAGPWAGNLIQGLGGDADNIYCPSLAWNVLFDKPSLSTHALAVQAKKPGSRALFATPWKGKIFVGCGHEPWKKSADKPMPNKAQLEYFITEVNESVPGLDLKYEDIGRVYCGLLPTIEPGSNVLTKREVIINHKKEGGPAGLYSIGGIKFTTARLVAEKIWGMVESDGKVLNPPKPLPVMTESASVVAQSLAEYEKDESVVHLDDLILRRTTLWEKGEDLDLAAIAGQFSRWDEQRRAEEVERCMLRIQKLRTDLIDQ